MVCRLTLGIQKAQCRCKFHTLSPKASIPCVYIYIYIYTWIPGVCVMWSLGSFGLGLLCCKLSLATLLPHRARLEEKPPEALELLCIPLLRAVLASELSKKSRPPKRTCLENAKIELLPTAARTGRHLGNSSCDKSFVGRGR